MSKVTVLLYPLTLLTLIVAPSPALACECDQLLELGFDAQVTEIPADSLGVVWRGDLYAADRKYAQLFTAQEMSADGAVMDVGVVVSSTYRDASRFGPHLINVADGFVVGNTYTIQTNDVEFPNAFRDLRPKVRITKKIRFTVAAATLADIAFAGKIEVGSLQQGIVHTQAYHNLCTSSFHGAWKDVRVALPASILRWQRLLDVRVAINGKPWQYQTSRCGDSYTTIANGMLTTRVFALCKTMTDASPKDEATLIEKLFTKTQSFVMDGNKHTDRSMVNNYEFTYITGDMQLTLQTTANGILWQKSMPIMVDCR